MSGDPAPHRGLVWAQTDRPARMWVEWSTHPSFRDRSVVRGTDAVPGCGYTARAHLTSLPSGRPVYYRVIFEDLSDLRTRSFAMLGQLTTTSPRARRLRLGWGGDVAGQGWGIDPDRGGYRSFETMKRFGFDAFIHSGDHVYADGPLRSTVELESGVWRNTMTPAKAKVAETLDEFRGQYAYNLLDRSFRDFFAHTPVIAQWDDHETLNNWYPNEMLDDERYREAQVSVLADRARQAFRESLPLDPTQPIHRSVPLGPLAEVFVLDARSFRGPNDPNAGPRKDWLGQMQVDWLKARLQASGSLWKIVASDMPLGLVIPDGPHHEGLANARPELGGREHELAEILTFAREKKIRNLLFVTADVHYAAAHHYRPDRAKFVDFDPFWELVAGPLHAGTFGPNDLDPTFGPEVMYTSRGPDDRQNLSPAEGEQFFGVLDIETSGVLHAAIHDQSGAQRWARSLTPLEE